jgi:PAS domain S-box-containing protein
LLSGAALVLLSREKVTNFQRAAAAAMAAVAIAIGALTLSQYLFGWDLHIDQLLFPETQRAVATARPSRMSPTTAFCCLLTGLAVFAAAQPRRQRLRRPFIAALATTVIVIGVLALAGYASEATLNSGWWYYAGTALHSALAFCALGAALLLLLNSEGALAWALGRRTTMGFAATAAVMLLAAGATDNFANQLLDTSTKVGGTQELLKEMQAIMTGMAKLESGQRGYIITGDEHLLQEREPTKAAVRANLDDVRQLTADNPDQQRFLGQLAPLIAQRNAFGDQTIAARRQQGFSAAEQMIATGAGIALTEKITGLLQDMENQEYSLLDNWQQQSATASTTTFLLLPMGAYLSLALLSVGLFFLNAGVVERKEAMALAERLAAIVESSDDAIIGKDLQGVVTSWNSGAENIFGYTASEIIGQPIMRLIPPDRQPEEKEILNRVRRGENVRHFDTVRVKKDGQPIDISVTVSPIKDDQGRIIGASKVARDITEQRLAEKLLRDSIKEVTDLQAALDEHAIVAITNPQGKITYVNDKFCAISRYSREELLGQDHRIINSGHHPKEFIRDLWTTIAQGRVWHGELKNKAKDGTVYWVDTTIVPFLNDQGKPRQYIAIRADITERKKTEEDLRKSEAQLQTVVESLDQGVVVSDLKGQVLHFNQAALGIHGFASLDECRRHLYEFADIFEIHRMDGSLLPLEQWPLACILRGESLHDWELGLRRKQSDWQRVLSYGGTLVHDASGQPLMAVVTMNDITSRKQAEEKINELNATLERRVVERTAQLEAANKELEAFSYSVSHDLRAPLRAIDGFSQAVEEDYAPQLPEEGRRYLRTIRDGAQRMGSLIDDLLAFSRLSRLPLNKQPVNTQKLVNEVLEEINPRQTERQIDLRLGELPPCQGDPVLLKQVWVNLLSNAFKYTRKRDVAIIEVGCMREPGANVYFVRDNGTGFDMKYVDKLFGVFQRLHRAEEYEGTGVGLAIVQRVVHRHGGRVWAEAALDRGATFYFTLEGETKL